jgi:hypothetical protein
MDAGHMITWTAFADQRPDLAEAGKGSLYRFGVGLAFLATTRSDGALHRDGRYADERAMAGPPTDMGTWEAFEFLLQSCLLTRTTGHGDPEPHHETWRPSL